MKKVVIVGGGFAGAKAARLLEKEFDVTLIDTKDYFEFTPSVLRTLVEPQHVKKIQVLHSHYLHKAHLIRDTVTKISKDKVHTKDQIYHYDYLIIASGTRYESPIKETNMVVTSRAHELRQYAKKLQDSQKILIIGGGIVGIELAAEIIEKYPNKEVTLAHSKSELIERNPKKAKEYAYKWLISKGAQIEFNQRVEKNQQGIYTTKTGKIFKPDLAFLCTGIMPNYEHMKEHCSQDLDERNFLCVNKYLQVTSFKKVFAAGDVNNIKEEKTAQSAEKQACLVAENIWNSEEGEPLVEYSSEAKPMLISLGKKAGILVYKSLVITGWFAGWLKTFVEWKTMRQFR